MWCHTMSCHVVWCDAMGWNDSDMGCYVMWFDGMWLYDVLNWEMICCELRRAYVTELRLRTSKNYGPECFTPALLRASPVLLHITNCYSVLESTTPYYKVLRRTTKCYYVLNITFFSRYYYKVLYSTTPYFKVLLDTTKSDSVLQCILKYCRVRQSITPYYKVFAPYFKLFWSGTP